MDKGSLFKGVERKAGANAPVFLRLKNRLSIAVSGALAIALNSNLAPQIPLGGFDPRSLFRNGEQGFFYDVSDLSTLFQDATGTIPVTGVGQPVALMLDKSGRGNHQAIGVPASRPVLRQNAITGAYYLETDGADDYMVSAPINFTGTDSVTLICGIRKLSDSTSRILLELSSNATTNSGAFYISAPESLALASISFKSRGSLSTNPSNASAPAPVSCVVTAIGRISTDTQIVMLNGVVAATSANDQGSGNYGEYPLYLFRRGGTTLPWAGHFYGLIGVGRLTSANETANTERWMARRVGVTLA